MFRRVYILSCILWCTVAAGAQTSMRDLTRAQIDSIVNPTLHVAASKTLLADKVSYDLGKLSEEDKPVSRTFRLRNVSKTSQRICRVRTSCGCTVADFDSVPFAPGAEVMVTLTYNPTCNISAKHPIVGSFTAETRVMRKLPPISLATIWRSAPVLVTSS